MLRRFFIPLMLVLLVAAAGTYWIFGRDAGHPRDVREAVPVEHFRLSNGLTVVVMPNTRMPAVIHLLAVKAGAADDPQGKSGLAHYVEHMMFSGTKTYPDGAYDRAVARLGGEQNAYTTKDYTLYYVAVAKDHLPTVMEIEADRMQHTDFTAEHAARELKVVTEERAARTGNSAAAELSEALDAITFLNHPYRQPAIGWAEDIASFTPQDAQGFFAQHYRAANMVLVMAGDVTPSQARRYAQRYYGGMPGGEATPRVWPHEPPLHLVRHAEMEDAKAHAPLLLRHYVAPSVGDGHLPQALALAVFAQYLGGGESSLLYESLVRGQRLASDVSVEYEPLAIGPAVFRVTATPVLGVGLPQLEQALDHSIDQALAATPSPADLARAKTLLKAQVIFAQDGLAPLGELMAQLYAMGLDETYFYEWAPRVEQVTAAMMMETARGVLQPNKRITGFLTPISAPMPSAVAMPVNEVPHAP